MKFSVFQNFEFHQNSRMKTSQCFSCGIHVGFLIINRPESTVTEPYSPPTYRFSLHNRRFLSQARQTRTKYHVRLAFWLIKRQLCRLNLYARARDSLVNKKYDGCFTTLIDLHSFISLHRNDEHGIGKTA